MSIKENWQALGQELGFTFKEGANAFLESPALATLSGHALAGAKNVNIEQVKQMMNNPFWQKLFSALFIGVVTGTHKGYEYNLFRSSTTYSGTGSHRVQHYVNITLLFHSFLDWGLNVYFSSLFTRLGKFLFRNSYIAVPFDEELNKLVGIRAKKKEEATLFFQQETFCREVKALFSTSRDFTITDYGIRYKIPGQIVSKEEALRIMDVMANCAQVMEKR